MAARITIERILRDNDDDSGQTIRQWRLESEAGNVVLKMNHGDGFIMVRPDDIDCLCGDLQRAKSAAIELGTERPSGRS